MGLSGGELVHGLSGGLLALSGEGQLRAPAGRGWRETQEARRRGGTLSSWATASDGGLVG